MSSVSTMLGLPIDHYVAVDMDGLAALIDALGGVTVDVGPEPLPIGGVTYSGRRVTPDGYVPAGRPAPRRRAGAVVRPVPARLGRLRPDGAPAVPDRRGAGAEAPVGRRRPVPDDRVRRRCVDHHERPAGPAAGAAGHGRRAPAAAAAQRLVRPGSARSRGRRRAVRPGRPGRRVHAPGRPCGVGPAGRRCRADARPVAAPPAPSSAAGGAPAASASPLPAPVAVAASCADRS